MASSKKDHKRRVQRRSMKIKEEKNKLEKDKREFINKLIEQERLKGAFDNNKEIPTGIVDDDLPINPSQGPSI
jgi:hypothetical protein